MVRHTNNTIVIEMPADTPEAQHSSLIHSIAAAMRLIASIDYSAIRANDLPESINPLMDLLDAITPDEFQLKAACAGKSKAA